MKFDILTIFPELIEVFFSVGIISKARKKGIIQIEVHNLRDYTKDRHGSVDDVPYGGGPGMVFKVEPIYEAINDICAHRNKPKRILMSPCGRKFNSHIAKELSAEEELLFICGRYEGIDERVREYLVDDEISIGDFVQMGGELPAMVVIEAVLRQVPGVLGKASSLKTESFSNDLLEYPQYTRPSDFKGWRVPEILLSGHHAHIEQWRYRHALLRTAQQRSDLLTKIQLSQEDKEWLKNKMKIE
ncbi:MAG: tRNA (guanosine(37)-N1)-methyltransferase TrmD [bacterium]